MQKLLLLPDVLLAALRGTPRQAVELINRCRTDPDIQAWVLADTVAMMVGEFEQDGSLTDWLHGLSQIPVNALLNAQALEMGGDFRLALHCSAAAVFKIPWLVTEQPVPLLPKGSKLTIEQALDLKEDDRDRVDQLNLNLGLHPIFDQVDGWFMEIIQNTAFAGGSHVSAFETEFAAFCGADYAVGLSNGTDALRFALIALGIQPGDEVITVPNTFIATTEAISQVGARPVFVDIRSDTYTLDPDLIEAKLTPRTRAIVPVHLYGQIADMAAIQKVAEQHGLKVLEDACQAHGARYRGRRAGTLGHAGAFSMYPGKNLGAFGEAGCVVTDDPAVAETIRCLREHGQTRKYVHRLEGYNGRMDNLQAAALRAKLPKLDEWNERRRDIASLYRQALSDISAVTLPAAPEPDAHVYHQFVILIPDPVALSSFLQQRDIQTAFHYPLPLHLQAAYSDRGEGPGCYPVTEHCAQRLLSLPMYPELTRRQIERVCTAVRAFLEL
jgi:dTDP-4-amino-4,6-dideoxygalactose transaminase